MRLPETDEKNSLIINNSVFLKFGELVLYEISETGDFQNSLPVQSKMADSGLKCKSNLGFRSFRNGASYVKSKNRGPCVATNVLHVRHPQIWFSLVLS